MNKDRRIVILLSPEDHLRAAAYATARRMSMSGIARMALLEELDRKQKTLHQANASKPKKEEKLLPMSKRPWEQLSDRGKQGALWHVWVHSWSGHMPQNDYSLLARESARKWIPVGVEPPRSPEDVPHLWEEDEEGED